MPRPMTSRKLLPENLTITEMLRRKPLAQLLADGDLYTVRSAAPLMHYHPQHLVKLCRGNRIEHVECPGRKLRWLLYARTVIRPPELHHRPQSATRRA